METDPFVKTAATQNILVDPLYFDERAACALTVKGANLLKQFCAAKMLPSEPSREEFVNIIKREGTEFSAAWRKERGIDDIKL